MAEYGVTKNGFVLKRLDTILEEIHTDQSEGFGFDTRQNPQSFLNVLNVAIANQIAELWETAQTSYYAKYPVTAEGINLDNAMQYGGIRRASNRPTYYSLHCSGDDGTYVRQGAIVASDTMPQVRLCAASGFKITRESFSRVKIRVAANGPGIYAVSVNGEQYSYSHTSGTDFSIIEGLMESFKNQEFSVSISSDDCYMTIEDRTTARSNVLILSENLTTAEVTTIANFATENYGKIVLAGRTITKIITNISGFNSVMNLLEPIYGRLQETDIEARHSYLNKSAIRSSRMIDSITSKLLNDVPNVESAIGYENADNVMDAEGRPPHSIEIIVEGGNEMDIAQTILDRKAGGIQTYGSIAVDVPGNYGDTIPIRFNRPQYIYAWLKVSLYGNEGQLPTNYKNLVIEAIVKYAGGLVAGDFLLSQLLNEGIYNSVAGVTYIDIRIATSTSSTFIPEDSDYIQINVEASSREKVLVSETRIGVMYDGTYS